MTITSCAIEWEHGGEHYSYGWHDRNAQAFPVPQIGALIHITDTSWSTNPDDKALNENFFLKVLAIKQYYEIGKCLRVYIHCGVANDND